MQRTTEIKDFQKETKLLDAKINNWRAHIFTVKTYKIIHIIMN